MHFKAVCQRCGIAFPSSPKEVARGLDKFCSTSCYWAALRLDNRRRAVERFWSKVDKSGDCWLWTGAVGSDGYGHIGWRIDGKLISLGAHRFGYELAKGPLPDGMEACHNCDVNYPPGDTTYRRCVRDTHLFAGTHADNMADMARKGRSRPRGRVPNLKCHRLLVADWLAAATGEPVPEWNCDE